MSKKLPAIFFGHGSPMLAVQSSAYTRAWSAIGRALPRPRAVLSVSAHWYVRGTHVTAMSAPRTLHDFGGFPPELYAVSYPAPGDPALAEHIRDLLGPLTIGLDQDWGLDHGTWSVLRHVFPGADVPVLQLSLDATKPAAFHYEVGKRLAPLREDRVLVIGSGNIVHNLRAYAWGNPSAPPLDWAVGFEDEVRKRLVAGDHDALIRYEIFGGEARLAVPTAEHYLPLLYIIALQGDEDAVTFPVEGIDGGSMSMLAVQIG